MAARNSGVRAALFAGFALLATLCGTRAANAGHILLSCNDLDGNGSTFLIDTDLFIVTELVDNKSGRTGPVQITDTEIDWVFPAGDDPDGDRYSFDRTTGDEQLKRWRPPSGHDLRSIHSTCSEDDAPSLPPGVHS